MNKKKGKRKNKTHTTKVTRKKEPKHDQIPTRRWPLHAIKRRTQVHIVKAKYHENTYMYKQKEREKV